MTNIHSRRGQTLVEYLVLLGLIAFLALASFRPHGVIDQTVQTSNDYFKTGARGVLSGYYDNQGTVVMEDPSAINGGWCAFSKCINGYKARECACPRPAFGGSECSGNAVESCGDGPTGTMCPAGLHPIIGSGNQKCGCYDYENYVNGQCVDKCAGITCAGGMTCSHGTCACTTGQTNCNGSCVDLVSDPAHCGTCGISCATNSFCENGVCINQCGGIPCTGGVCSGGQC